MGLGKRKGDALMLVYQGCAPNVVLVVPAGYAGYSRPLWSMFATSTYLPCGPGGMRFAAYQYDPLSPVSSASKRATLIVRVGHVPLCSHQRVSALSSPMPMT